MEFLGLDNELLEVSSGMTRGVHIDRQLSFLETVLKLERGAAADLLRGIPPGFTKFSGAQLTFTGVYTAVCGRRAGKVDGDKQDLLAAILKYENCRRRILIIERDRATLLRIRSDLTGVERRVAELSEGRKIYLELPGGDTFARLAAVTDMLVGARLRERELLDIMQAGELAQRALKRLIHILQDTQGRGTWELLSTSSAARPRLDEALVAILDAQDYLLHFERELVNDVSDADNPGSLAGVADIIIDALVVEMLTQSEICESLDAVVALDERIASLLGANARALEGIAHAIRTGIEDRRRFSAQIE